MADNLPAKQSTSVIDEQTIRDFLFTSGTKLNPQQQALFIRMAQEFNLNPFKREIYAIPFGQEFSIVTGYQTYLARAEATGKLDGWEVAISQDGTAARITIYRKDFTKPFVWTVSRKDFDKGRGGWSRMPDFMLKKVAIGQGFRLAFPNEFSGMPCLQEEIGDNPEENGKPEPEKPKAANPAKSEPKPAAATPPTLDKPVPAKLSPEQQWYKDDWKSELDKAVKDKVINNQDVRNTIKLKKGTDWASLSYEQARAVREAFSEKLGPIPDVTSGTDFNPDPVQPPKM